MVRFTNKIYKLRWDPSKRMTPDEAHRHEWFAAAGASTGSATSPAQSGPSGPSISSSTNNLKCQQQQQHQTDDSDGIFSASSASSTGSGLPAAGSGVDRTSMYQVFKGSSSKTKQPAPPPADEMDNDEAASHKRRIDPVGDACNSNPAAASEESPSIL